MTVGIAARYAGGVLLGSDSLCSIGDQRLYITEIKAFRWSGCHILVAGDLEIIQRFQAREESVENNGYAAAVQASLWADPLPKKIRSAMEFVVVDCEQALFIVSGHGDVIAQKNYAVAGSELAWVGLDLEYPKLRNRTLTATKNMMARVLRAVCKRDSTCDGAFHYWDIKE